MFSGTKHLVKFILSNFLFYNIIFLPPIVCEDIGRFLLRQITLINNIKERKEYEED